jgi:hypothetical protein
MYCSSCGSPSDGNRFCGNCGSHASKTPPPGTAAVKTGKTKSTAVLLAVLLGYWTFVYSYKADKWKFWGWLAFSMTVPVCGFVLLISFKNVYGWPDAFSLGLYFSDLLAGSPESQGGNYWSRSFFPIVNWSLLATIMTATMSWSGAVIKTLRRPWTFFEKL